MVAGLSASVSPRSIMVNKSPAAMITCLAFVRSSVGMLLFAVSPCPAQPQRASAMMAAMAKAMAKAFAVPFRFVCSLCSIDSSFEFGAAPSCAFMRPASILACADAGSDLPK